MKYKSAAIRALGCCRSYPLIIMNMYQPVCHCRDINIIICRVPYHTFNSPCVVRTLSTKGSLPKETNKTNNHSNSQKIWAGDVFAYIKVQQSFGTRILSERYHCTEESLQEGFFQGALARLAWPSRPRRPTTQYNNNKHRRIQIRLMCKGIYVYVAHAFK